jgi:hypothetical protein
MALKSAQNIIITHIERKEETFDRNVYGFVADLIQPKEDLGGK